MDTIMFLNLLMEVAGILNKSRKLFIKNKKLMFSVLLFPLLLNSLIYLFNAISIKSEITNLLLETNLLPLLDPSTPEFASHLMKVFFDFRQFVASAYIFTISASIISLIFTLAIVNASAITYKEENVTIKEFLVFTIKSLKGPFVTNFYILLFKFGYLFLFFIALFPLMIFSSNSTSLGPKIRFLWLFFAVLEAYLSIVWYLSMIISILEETYGIQALGKAAKIAKGVKLKLFVVNLLFLLLNFGLTQVATLIDFTQSFGVVLGIGLVGLSLIFGLRVFVLVVYTLAYFEYKNNQGQGEDIESQRDVEYTKLSSTALVGMLP